MVYILVMIVQIISNNISPQRPVLYLLSSLSIFGVIKLEKLDPSFVVALAPMSILTFCTFIFNDGSLYTDHDDPCHLMVGFMSTTYLAACFQSLNWETTLQFMLFADIIVGKYYVEHFGYKQFRIASVLILHLLSCSLICFSFEIKDKKEFLER
jgi:hypothetical protein